ALRLRHPEVTEKALLGVAAFLFTYYHDRALFKPRHPGHNRRIVAKCAIAVYFLKIRKNTLDVIERVRTFGVPRQLNSAPRGILFGLRAALFGGRLGIHSKHITSALPPEEESGASGRKATRFVRRSTGRRLCKRPTRSITSCQYCQPKR